jgi:hypothetical protein
MFYARLFFRYLFGGPVPETPEFDAELALTDPVMREVRDRVRHGDWQAGRKLVADAGDDWDLRGWRLSMLAGLAVEDDRWLYAWLSAEPYDPAAVLIQASMLSRRAADARGSATASHTSAEQFQNFHELSRAAAEVGRRAVEVAGPGDPGPYVLMMRTMFADRQARSMSFDEVFDEGRRRDPYNFDLHLTAISLKCEKWSGSHEEMFGIARGVAAAAPPGNRAVLLPLFAHYEYALREFSWGDTDDKKALKACQKYFRSPAVRQEIEEWIAKYRAAPRTSAQLSTARQWMALHYSLTGRKKDAKVLFDELGQYVVAANEWGYIYGGAEYGYLKSWWWANGA